jgi:hypothetical protein
MMKFNLHSLIFPLLSTLFFLVLLLALNAVYEPLELKNATPVAPMSTITREVLLSTSPSGTTALNP